MIKVTIELHPGGDERRAKEIGVVCICNVSDLADVSDYAAYVKTSGHVALGIPPQDEVVKITGHDRRQSITALLAKVFQKVKA